MVVFTDKSPKGQLETCFLSTGSRLYLSWYWCQIMLNKIRYTKCKNIFGVFAFCISLGFIINHGWRRTALQVLGLLTVGGLLFIIMMAVIPIKVNIYFHKSGADDQFVVKLMALRGLWGYKLEIPQGEWLWGELFPFLYIKSEVESRAGSQLNQEEVKIKRLPTYYIPYLNKLFPLIKKIRKLLSIQKMLLRSTIMEEFKWHTEIGLKDAARASILYGIIWGTKNFILFNIRCNSQVKFAYPDYRVTINYLKEVFHVEFNCIFTVRTGHIILAGALTAWQLFVAFFERGQS